MSRLQRLDETTQKREQTILSKKLKAEAKLQKNDAQTMEFNCRRRTQIELSREKSKKREAVVDDLKKY